jgi:hypothetical protein
MRLGKTAEDRIFLQWQLIRPAPRNALEFHEPLFYFAIADSDAVAPGWSCTADAPPRLETYGRSAGDPCRGIPHR